MPGRRRQRARGCARGRARGGRPDRGGRLPGRADDAPRVGRVGRPGARRARARHRGRPAAAVGGRRPRRRAHRRRAGRRRSRRVSPCAPRSTSFRSASSRRSTCSCERRPPATGSTRCSTRSTGCAHEVGSPPLAAPIGQIVASQALLNVLGANRYSTMVDELRDLGRGRFGRTPGPVDPALKRAVELFGGEPTPTSRSTSMSCARGGRAGRERGGAAAARALRRGGGAAAARDPRALGRRRVAGGAAASTRCAQERIREVVRIVQETGVGEITIEEDGMRVSVRRTAETAPAAAPPPAAPTGRRRRAPLRRPPRRRARARREPDGRDVLPRARPGARRSWRRATRSRPGRRSASSRR